MDAALPQLDELIAQRLALLHRLAESLEFSRLALARNDLEAIERGASHQAELCRQWSLLEEELQRESSQRSPADPAEPRSSAHFQVEWDALETRIRHLTRVHWSLLRHMQRSLVVLNRVVESCAPTYTPAPGLLRTDARLRAGG